MDNKITLINVYTKNDLYDSAEVTYENSTEPKIIKGFNNIVNILSEFSMQEHMLLEELISNKKVVLKQKTNKFGVEKKNSKAKRIAALFVTGVLIGSGIYALSRQKKYMDK